MNREDQIKYNKMIAEFRGYSLKWIDIEYGYKKGTNIPDTARMRVYVGDFIGDNRGYIEPECLKYHSSWDWLMPVIERIEKLNTSFTISHLYCFVERESQDFRLMQDDFNCGKTKLESAYKAVIEFIKWWNKNGRGLNNE